MNIDNHCQQCRQLRARLRFAGLWLICVSSVLIAVASSLGLALSAIGAR